MAGEGAGEGANPPQDMQIPVTTPTPNYHTLITNWNLYVTHDPTTALITLKTLHHSLQHIPDPTEHLLQQLQQTWQIHPQQLPDHTYPTLLTTLLACHHHQHSQTPTQPPPSPPQPTQPSLETLLISSPTITHELQQFTDSTTTHTPTSYPTLTTCLQPMMATQPTELITQCSSIHCLQLAHIFGLDGSGEKDLLINGFVFVFCTCHCSLKHLVFGTLCSMHE